MKLELRADALWNNLSQLPSRFLPTGTRNNSLPADTLRAIDLVEKARQEWLAAKSYFNAVSDPDLVDYAIHLVEAAEKKYMYLLKKARQNGIKWEWREGEPEGDLR